MWKGAAVIFGGSHSDETTQVMIEHAQWIDEFEPEEAHDTCVNEEYNDADVDDRKVTLEYIMDENKDDGLWQRLVDGVARAMIDHDDHTRDDESGPWSSVNAERSRFHHMLFQSNEFKTISSCDESVGSAHEEDSCEWHASNQFK